jgi:hypothetical protein
MYKNSRHAVVMAESPEKIDWKRPPRGGASSDLYMCIGIGSPGCSAHFEKSPEKNDKKCDAEWVEGGGWVDTITLWPQLLISTP